MPSDLHRTMRGPAAALALAIALPVACLAPTDAASAPDACLSVTDGHGTQFGNGGEGPVAGKALGQTFYASDTVITKITLWRPGWDRSVMGAKLFVTTVDTVNYDPPRPITQGLLLDGPTIHVYEGDPPGSLIEMPFVIDPPLRLPHPGTYAWFVQADHCDIGFAWAILADWDNRYPHGMLWVTGRAVTGCFLPRAHLSDPPVDLNFEIEYCRDAITPVRKDTWGRLKLRYR